MKTLKAMYRKIQIKSECSKIITATSEVSTECSKIIKAASLLEVSTANLKNTKIL